MRPISDDFRSLPVAGRKAFTWTGRGERIRTSDPLLPKQMRYQAAPHPVDHSKRGVSCHDAAPIATNPLKTTSGLEGSHEFEDAGRPRQITTRDVGTSLREGDIARPTRYDGVSQNPLPGPPHA